MEFIIIQRMWINEDACKNDTIERRNPLCSVFGLNPHTNDFHGFVFIVLYFVTDGSFTADGGLL